MNARCLSDNGWDYTKAAQSFVELNVRIQSVLKNVAANCNSFFNLQLIFYRLLI